MKMSELPKEAAEELVWLLKGIENEDRMEFAGSFWQAKCEEFEAAWGVSPYDVEVEDAVAEA